MNENKDFFEEDVVFIDWINVLEMAVKFENEGTEAMPTRGPHRKAIALSSGASSSPEKVRPQSTKREKSKKQIQKLKEISYKIHQKNERRKRKYKKKEIENIGWYYEEANDSKVRDLIESISILSNIEENDNFFSFIFNTAFIQDSSKKFNFENYKLVKTIISPVLFNKGLPILLNTAVKSLILHEFYSQMTNQILKIDFMDTNFLEADLFNPKLKISTQIDKPKIFQVCSFSSNKSIEATYGKFREGIQADVKSIMIVEVFNDLIINQELDKNYIIDDFWLTNQALFLTRQNI